MNGQVGHPRPTAPASTSGAAVLTVPPDRPYAWSGAVVPTIAVLLAAALLAGVALAALGSGTASAATVLAEGTGVTATRADGTVEPLEVGSEVSRGATVRVTGAGAVLRTRDRDVLLGPDAQVIVVDGARQALRAGVVMVDARRGPGLTIETAAADVLTPDGAVARVEPGPLLRVGAFAGDALQVRAAGRRATTEVTALHQVQVPAGGLPSRSTPLALTGDAAERRLAGELVADDRALAALGEMLDSPGDQGPAVLAALRGALPSVAVADPIVRAVSAEPAPATDLRLSAPAPPRSEAALAFLLAAASGPAAPAGDDDPAALGSDPRLADRYVEARGLRSAGGSWGVVARLLDSPVPAVGALLDRLLSPFVLLAGEAPAPFDLLALLDPATGAGPSGPTSGELPGADEPGSGPAPGAPPPGPGPGPDQPPPPGPVPPPPDDPVGTVVETVEVVVETVIGLLPDPPQTPAPAPSPAAPQAPAVPEVSEVPAAPALPDAPAPSLPG